MRARVVEGQVRRGDPWKRFRAGRWYPAEWVDGRGGDVRLLDGNAAAVWAREAVEIRVAEDDEWEVRALSRLNASMDGQMIEYPGRVAECPEGHVRSIPSRFDAPVVELRCADCRRGYRLVSDS